MIAILNAIIAGFGKILSTLINLLPTSPFSFSLNIDNKLIALINFIFPVSSMIAHLELYLTAVAIWYGVRIVLRWIKAASN
jgi:hypothetical protein